MANYIKAFLEPRVELIKLIRQLKAMKADILNWESIERAQREYTGNRYKDYGTAVAEISKKYNGAADWGVLLTGNIIDLRAIFIISEGIQVVPKKGVKYEEAEKELTWANDFLEFNGLDKEAAQAYTREAEIEGKIALRLMPKQLQKDEFKNYGTMIRASYISWTDKKYKVKTAPNDPMDYVTLTWKPRSKADETLKAHQFVYKKFGGRANKPNDAQPKIMKCLTEIEDVSKALRDWREIDRLFGAPFPGFQCATAAEAEKMQGQIDKINWKIKKIIAHTGVFKYYTPDMGGTASLDSEILRLLTMISGTTGVPLHWLGVTELLKQVATADDLREMANMATTPERMTWTGAYDETITKAMKMANEVNQAGEGKLKLDPNKIMVRIPVVSREQWTRLEKVYLPLSTAGKISDEMLLSNIPGAELHEELKRKQEADNAEVKRIKADNDRLTQELADAQNNPMGTAQQEE